MRLVLAIALLALVSAAGAAGSGRPHLALVQASPVVVSGTGFAPGRIVVVSYASGPRRARRAVRAGAQGGVRVVFKGVVFDRCRGATLRAGSAPALVVLPCTTPGGLPTVDGTIVGFVRGIAFVPGEHVAVTGRTSGQSPAATKLDAGSDGSFVAQLALPRTERCGELFIRAVGSLGSTATATVAGPDCKSP
jgi:hypothetical protein